MGEFPWPKKPLHTPYKMDTVSFPRRKNKQEISFLHSSRLFWVYLKCTVCFQLAFPRAEERSGREIRPFLALLELGLFEQGFRR